MARGADTPVAPVMHVVPPVADLRAAPDPRAERVSQLLCLTPCEVLEEDGDFVRVRGPDGYEGWARRSHLGHGPPPEPNLKITVPFARVIDPATGETISHLPLDTRVRGEVTGRGVRLWLPGGREGLVPREAVLPADRRGTEPDLISTGLSLRGVPYLWGGTSSFGFDCSGLVQRLFHFVFNRWLPRDSREQRAAGKGISLDELEPGDLIFFPGHVALWVGDGLILHASSREGMVSLTPLTEVGADIVGARRVSPPRPGHAGR